MNLLKKLDCFDYIDAKFNLLSISNEKLRSLYTYFGKGLSSKISRGGVEKKMKFTKLLRNKKAISPIFATLILIAIAVIAGIVVYMFTSGTIASMTGGGTAGQEKVAVQAVEVDTAGTGLTVWAKSTGGGDVQIDGIIVKDSQGTIVDVIDSVGGTTLGLLDADGTLTDVTGTSGTALTVGDSYTVTLTSEGGGSFVSASFKP